MEGPGLKAVLEALLFVAGRPVKVEELRELLPEASREEIREALEELSREYAGRGIRIREVAGGFRMETAPEVAGPVRAFLKPRPRKLSRSALETLAVVAYHQPVTRAEIERLRGVDSSGPLKVLLEEKLIRIVGRKAVPGRPLLYGTTPRFLEVFGLRSLKDLPPLEEIRKLAEGA